MCALRPEIVEARREIRPPMQPTVKKGDIVIRDLRLWHAGMPNETDKERIMIAIGYQVKPRVVDRKTGADNLIGTLVSKPSSATYFASLTVQLLPGRWRSAS